MSEAKTLVKIVALLGILAIFMGVLPGGDTTVWDNFSSAIKQGPNLPTFYNPYAAIVLGSSLVPDFPGSIPSPIPDVLPNVNQCDAATYWECWNDGDDQSWAQIGRDALGTIDCNAVRPCPSLPVNWTATWFANGVNASTVIVAANVIVTCTNTVGTRSISVFVNSFGATLTPCNGDSESTTDYTRFYVGHTLGELDGADGTISVYETVNNIGLARIQVREVRIDLYVIEPPITCDNDVPLFGDVACAIWLGANAIWKAILFIAFGIWFVISTVAAILIFVGSIIVNLFIGIFTLIAAYFSIPGVPAFLQAFIDILLIGIVVFIIYTLVKLLRGSGGGPA